MGIILWVRFISWGFVILILFLSFCFFGKIWFCFLSVRFYVVFIFYLIVLRFFQFCPLFSEHMLGTWAIFNRNPLSFSILLLTQGNSKNMGLTTKKMMREQTVSSGKHQGAFVQISLSFFMGWIILLGFHERLQSVI